MTHARSRRSDAASLHTLCRPWAGVCLALFLAACSTGIRAPVEDRSVFGTARVPPPPPTTTGPRAGSARAAIAEGDWRPGTYTVKRGDTLYGIALEFGLDYRELAALNNIQNIDRIFVGQVLRLNATGEAQAAAAPAATGTEPAATTATGSAEVVTTPLRSLPPLVSPGAPAAPTGAPAKTAASPVDAKTVAAAAAAARNTDTYKTQPKVTKEPYSERALREMQAAGGGAPTASPAPATPDAAPVVVARAAPAGSKPPAAGSASPPAATPAPPPAAAAAPPTPTPAAPPSPPASGNDDDRLGWVWPATGRLVTGFSDTANLKGIDIAGKEGQPIVASAGGKVVYAGSGLRGYGKLIIIKHNATYLSAYAHNREILVKEGQLVNRGQRIAEMGSTDAEQVKLHFEIRRLGKPLDPLQFLPPP